MFLNTSKYKYDRETRTRDFAHVNNKDFFFCVWTTKAQTKLRMRMLPCEDAYLGVYVSNHEFKNEYI